MRVLVLAGFCLGSLAFAPPGQSQPLVGDDIDMLAVAIEDGILRYDLEVAGEARTVSYSAPRQGVADVRVTDKRGRELVSVRASRRATTVRVNGEVVRLRDGQSLYDVEAVDLTAVWLVDQNFAASRSIGLEWLGEVAAAANGGEPAPSTQGLFDIPGRVIGIIGDIVGGDGGGGRCSSSSAMCNEEDIDGNTTVVTKQCECGVAFCNTQQFSVEVPVAFAYPDGSIDIRTEQREFTRCLCGCLRYSDR